MKKITKNQAWEKFKKGKTIYLLPSKANLNSIWVSPYSLTKQSYEENSIYENLFDFFNCMLNAYSYYNCNSETGKRIAFYVKEV